MDLNYLPYYDCVESGVFENLLTWMDEDPVVKKDELYTNVLDAVTYKGSVAGLPLAFLLGGGAAEQEIPGGGGRGRSAGNSQLPGDDGLV